MALAIAFRAKAISFNQHSIRQMKQTARDALVTQSDIHKKKTPAQKY